MHYTVAVVTKNGTEEEVNELLAPFDENITVEPYVAETKQEIIDRVRNEKAKLEEDIAWYAKDPEEYKKQRRVYWLSEENVNPQVMLEYWKQLCACNTDEECYNFRHYDDEDYDESGGRLSTYNPKSKWDWYVIGGRWDGYFERKDGTTTNSEKISELVWEQTEEAKAEYRRFWEVVVEGDELKEGEEKTMFFSLYKPEYYLNRYHTKEEYAQRCSEICPYAVVTHEGEWIAPGEMHWFNSTETDEDQAKYEEWFKKFREEHQDYYITLVDCHI